MYSGGGALKRTQFSHTTAPVLDATECGKPGRSQIEARELGRLVVRAADCERRAAESYLFPIPRTVAYKIRNSVRSMVQSSPPEFSIAIPLTS